MKKLFAMVLTLALLATSAFALADEIIMGCNATWAPFESVDDNGEIVGFDVEIAQLIAADLGKDLKIEDMYFDGLIPALDVGTIDMLISGMTITDERKEMVLFSDPYYVVEQAVIVMKGYDEITSTEDIASKKVAVQDGTTGFFMCEDDLGVESSNLFAFKAAPDTILELEAGRVDCIIIDDAIAQNFLAMNENLEIVEGLEMPAEEYGIAVKMDNQELLDSINATLAKIQEDGTYDALIEKYFN